MAVTGTSNLLEQNSLSIRISADGFSFYVADASSNTLWRRKDIRIGEGENYDEVFQQTLDAQSKKGVSQVCLISEYPSTRIPLEEFRREDLADLYHVVYDEVDLRQMDVCYTVLPQLEAVEIFTVPKTVHNMVLNAFPMATVANSCGLVLERLMTYHREHFSAARAFYTFATPSFVFVFCLEVGGLVYANTFPANTASEELYFILYAWQTLGLDTEKDFFLVAGHEESCKPIAEGASKYVRNINVLAEVGKDFQSLY